MLLRRVERVPLLGGRISIEAIREGLDAIGLLPAGLAQSGPASSTPVAGRAAG
jgi:hypothetical protein